MKFIFLLLLPISLLLQTPTSELPYKDQPISKKIQHHKRWLNTSDNLPGKQLNVDNEDLTGVDFSDIDLSKAKFKNCILKFAMFSNTNLSLTEFVDCDFSGSKFIEANLRGSYFRNSRFRRCGFSKTHLDDSEIRVCDFESAVIQEPIARNTDFSGSNFNARYLNFSDVHSKANFSGCSWSNGNQCDTESFGYCKQVVDNN